MQGDVPLDGRYDESRNDEGTEQSNCVIDYPQKVLIRKCRSILPSRYLGQAWVSPGTGGRRQVYRYFRWFHGSC